MSSLASNLLVHGPSMLIWTLGLLLALVRWRRHPAVSAVAAGAFCVLLFTSFFSIVFYTLGPQYLAQYLAGGWEGDLLPLVFSVVSFGLALLRAAAWALILIAVFGWRIPYGAEAGWPRRPDFSADPDHS